MLTSVTATSDGLGYWVTVGVLRSFVSSFHLVESKKAQLTRLQEDS